MNKYILDTYFEEQKENAKLKNKMRFIKEHKDYMTFKQRMRYLIRYSPSINSLVQGRYFIEGLEEGTNKGSRK